MTQEQQAELRHAAFRPALAAAAAATQAWLAAQGGRTTAEALSVCRTGSDTECSQQRAVCSASNVNPRHIQLSAAHAVGACKPCGAAVSSSDDSSANDVDYIALAAMKGTLRPELRFSSSGSSDLPGVTETEV